MTSIKGYVMLSVGSLLTFGGMFQSFNSLGTLDLVLGWAVVAVVGMFVLALGTRYVLIDSGEAERVDPRKAPGKTD